MVQGEIQACVETDIEIFEIFKWRVSWKLWLLFIDRKEITLLSNYLFCCVPIAIFSILNYCSSILCLFSSYNNRDISFYDVSVWNFTIYSLQWNIFLSSSLTLKKLAAGQLFIKSLLMNGSNGHFYGSKIWYKFVSIAMAITLMLMFHNCLFINVKSIS